MRCYGRNEGYPRPPTRADPYVRDYGIRLLPQVCDAKKRSSGYLLQALDVDSALLTAKKIAETMRQVIQAM